MAGQTHFADASRYRLRTIGGIFGTTDHDRYLSDVHQGEFDLWFPGKLHDKTRVFYETGIDALAAILQPIADRQGRVQLWVTDNFCGESLRRLAIKLDQRFDLVRYQDTRRLQEATPNDVVLWLHFNRYDPATADAIGAIKRKTGATVIEDFVQAPLDIARFQGDFAFNSLRKYSSIDVAVAYHGATQIPDATESRYHMLRKEAEQVRSQFLIHPSQDLEQQFLELTRESDAALSVKSISLAHHEDVYRAMRFDFQSSRNRRRRNYSLLSTRLTEMSPRIRILPGEYMYLVIETEGRDAIRSEMFTQRIFPVIHWADSKSEESRSILSFHIDQRYGDDDMHRVADTLIETRIRQAA